MQLDRWLALAPLGLALYGLIALMLWWLLRRRLRALLIEARSARWREPQSQRVILTLVAATLGIASGLLLALCPLPMVLRFVLLSLSATALSLLTVAVLS